ncbi:DUF805 domain-containing protein [Asticcacaulis sp. DW145]|uniref:hypothetical protein n=1 Tax=Asticcacaulis sp. DW145 TaxID=3095608 RepID=UPI00308548AB|nr:DUF805 domain-containing protein [Asticcacaulis sp. DW145]
MRRPAFALILLALAALVCAPDIARRFMDIDAPWLGWLQVALMAAGVILAARARLCDAGKPEGWLWQALLIVTPIYALFASPVAGLLPIPSQLSTLALIGANGIVFGGLILLGLLPSGSGDKAAKPRHATGYGEVDSGVSPFLATSPSHKSGHTSDSSGSDAHSSADSGDGGGDGGGGD